MDDMDMKLNEWMAGYMYGWRNGWMEGIIKEGWTDL